MVISVSDAFACSCVRSSTVDQEFKKAANVVVLKARSLERTEKEPPRLVNYGGIKQTTLTVEKVYKGNLKIGQELILAQGGGADCVWTFDEENIGQEFLFYLGAGPLDLKSSDNVIAATGQFPRVTPRNVWVASTCSRSGGVDYRANDIKYLDSRSKVAGKTRLSGQLSQYIAASIEGERSEYKLLENYKIKISGNGKDIELKTDKHGGYEIYDLPPGKYKLFPESVEGYAFYDGMSGPIEVELKAGQHTEQGFDYFIRNAIRGKLIDANGKPLTGVCLRLVPSRGKAAKYFYQGDCTEPNGSFEFERIPAGSYVIAVNQDGKVTAAEPFETFYYPSAIHREDAIEITIGPGQIRDDLIIAAPTTAEVIEVSGILLFENGKPAGGGDEEPFFVEFFAEARTPKSGKNTEADSRAITDKNGRFTIRILKGQVGNLFGKTITFEGEYENCPRLDRIIRAQGRFVGDVQTKPFRIDATNDVSGIELRFPFPPCKKKRIE